MLVARRTESLHSGYRLRFNVCFDCGLVPINEILSPLCNTAESLYTKFSELFFVYVMHAHNKEGQGYRRNLFHLIFSFIV